MTIRPLLAFCLTLVFSTGCHLLVDVPPRPGDSDLCGNDQLDVGETCDGEHFIMGISCLSLGYASGTLACASDCTPDTTGCDLPENCGDGYVDVGEDCDGLDLNDQTCELQGFASGMLACAANCKFDTTGCDVPENCGNGGVDTGEDCDGTNLDDQTCELQGFASGTLACATNCTFDTTGCDVPENCGNGQINAGEDCDGANLNGQTCQLQGFPGGTLACAANCRFDTSYCVPMSSNADLATLTVSTGPMIPAFSPTTTTYMVRVHNAVSGMMVAATAADAPLATVLIEPAQPMTLAVGDNLATVTVTAEDGTQKVYTVTVIRNDVDYTSPNIGLLVFVPAGTFQRDATPTNLSTVSAFRMSQHEVTRAQWTAVTGWADPSHTTFSSGTSDPVQNVSWYDAIAFCNKLSLLEGLTPVYTVSGVDFATLTYAQIPTGTNATWNAATANWAANGYRLPTEMEWMWAAMGADAENPGQTNTTGYAKAFAGSTGSNLIGDYAVFGWSTSETGRTPTQRSNTVGSKLANELGFNDLSGNVWEWTWDIYGASYPTGTLTDHRGPASGPDRVDRGGAWNIGASICTVAYRSSYYPFGRSYYIGFRVVRP